MQKPCVHGIISMLLAALSMVCVPTIHCSRIPCPLHHQRRSLQSWYWLTTWCAEPARGQQPNCDVSQSADGQGGLAACVADRGICTAGLGVQRVIAACAHKHTDIHTQAYQQGGTAVRECTVSLGA